MEFKTNLFKLYNLPEIAKVSESVAFRLNYLSNVSVSQIWDLRLMSPLEDILEAVTQATMCNSTISAALIYVD